MFKGSMVALVTPMHSNGDIDEKSLRNLVEFHLDAKTDAILAVGTTGESATLTDEEQLSVIKIVIDNVAGRVPVIAGTGANSTAKAISLTKNAMNAGADACLVVTPYYNKPTQEGLYQHYKSIADSVDVPIILYNVPGRTAVDLLPDTVARLAPHPNIVAIKEASGKIERTKEILELCGSEMEVYSGEDPVAMELILGGAKGVISVTANVAPRLMHEMCQASLTGDREKAESINQRLVPLHKALFLESNPIPAKWALCKMGLIPSGIRLPLTDLDEQYHKDVLEALAKADINTE